MKAADLKLLKITFEVTFTCKAYLEILVLWFTSTLTSSAPEQFF